ncbi:phage tail protein [Hansschlegelia beijingensis]
MNLMRLFIRFSRIARTRQPTWKLAAIGIVIAFAVVAAAVEAAGLWPEWLKAHGVRAPRLHL